MSVNWKLWPTPCLIPRKPTGHYAKLERQICALEIFAIVLFCLLAGQAIYLVYNQKVDDALKISMPLGALISAMLVAKVASRLLAHNVILREDDRRQDIVRIAHHLLAVISDLRNRVAYTADMFRGGSQPLVILIENAAAIEKRYEVFLDREVYRFLSGETIELIGRMSGHVFGLKGLAEIYRAKPSTKIPTGEHPVSKQMIEGLESLLRDLNVLDKQIRQLRGGVNNGDRNNRGQPTDKYSGMN